MSSSIKLSCPWCGERFETFADGSGGDAEYIEDCPVCCKGINVRIATDGEGELMEWSASDDR